ncbi:MAG: hypothetical protein K0R92_514 [Lachnospiraceae bacterium]|jgi:hypothetical protein|nr:hypothetical protein [Lachnospiraceae bacterium]
MVNVSFSESGVATYDKHAFYQYDYGRTLVIDGLELPATVQVHFARKDVPAEIMLGTTVDGVMTVEVPATTLQYAGEFNVYIFLTTDTTGKTYKTLSFTTRKREKPLDYAAEAEPGIIDQLTQKLNQIIDTGIASYVPDEAAVNAMILSYVQANLITNNDAATVPGTAWDAVRGKQIRTDLNTLNNNLAYTRGTITLSSGFTAVINKTWKQGILRVISGSINGTFAAGVAHTIGTVPADFKPDVTRWTAGATPSGASATVGVTGTAGEVVIIPKDAATEIRFTLIYFTW